MEELIREPAVRLAGMIRRRELSPVELVESCLARIEELNGSLNLFCALYPEEARAGARRAERAAVRGEWWGPLHGLPYALKDDVPVRGRTTTLGSFAYRDWVPEESAPVAERLAAAGGILLGKTTTPEFAHSGFTHSPLWGVSRNPWDPSCTPGGSSGGSAGAVAAGMVPLAEGSDAGGSVRIPASLCGVVGLKPSLGRVPVHLVATDFEPILHVGPIARSVEDVALLLSVMQGPDERDPLSLVPALEMPGGFETDLTGLRLALSLDLGYYRIHPDVEANTRRVAQLLAERGAQVEEVELGWSRAINDAWFGYWAVLLATLFGHLLSAHGEHLDPEVVALIERGGGMSAVDLKRIDLLRSRQWAALRPVLEAHHALLCPTVAVPAPAAEGRDADFGSDTPEGRYAGYDLTAPFNFLSPCPAISAPSGLDGEGRPTGLQIVGRRYQDLLVLRVAAALQEAAPWPAPPL